MCPALGGHHGQIHHKISSPRPLQPENTLPVPAPLILYQRNWPIKILRSSLNGLQTERKLLFKLATFKMYSGGLTPRCMIIYEQFIVLILIQQYCYPVIKEIG